MGSKGKAPSSIDDAPWVEKYRPKTLDDVAAHKEIIDTSEKCPRLVSSSLSETQKWLLACLNSQ